MKKIFFLILLLSVFEIFAINADWKKKTISYYQQGNIEKVREIIGSFQPFTDADKSFILYYQAKIQLDIFSTKTSFEKLTNTHPETDFGQKAFLELAKIYLLESNFPQAQKCLNNITKSKSENKFFWQAQLYFQSQKFDSAIEESRKFIEKSNDNDLIETSYLLMAESKIKQKKYHEALEILVEFKNSEFIDHQIVGLLYKTGFCNEKIGEIEKATNYYKKVINEYTYTKYANDAQIRLNKIGNLSQVSESNNIPAIIHKPKKGKNTYLQAGAFSSKKNAELRVTQVKNLHYESHIFEAKGKFKVAVGPFNIDSNLKKAKKVLKENNIPTFKIRK